MKTKIIILNLIFTVIFFGLLNSPVFADCEVASFDQNTRDLQVCVGEFNTVSELRNTTATFNCLNNSNLFPGGICSGITGPTDFSLSSVSDTTIATDSNGKYYTCITVQGVNRAIGSMSVTFTGGTTCTTDNITTQPNDWNIALEGLPWHQGTNTPTVSRSIFCADGKSIDTAIGCIKVTGPDAGSNLIKIILQLSLGVGGGIALALILSGIFTITTSAGNPDKLKSGGEIITSAVIGLIFIILSVFLVNLIGINILGIPGLA